MEPARKFLIIEDDSHIADVIEIHVRDLGYHLDRATDGKTGLDKALNGDYALVILDLMLPVLDGLEVCKRIRAEDRHVPILMLTARSIDMDKILGLELGADDYITKPFNMRELIARIKAIIRRVEVDDQKYADRRESNILDYGPLSIDLQKRRVTLAGTATDLTAKEFDLLVLLASNPGRVYKRSELLDLVWGYQYDGYDHTVNSHINRLRNKIEKDPANPLFIRTLWGMGYRFADPEELHS